MDSVYSHGEIEKKWQKKWRSEKIFSASDKLARKYYLLVELTYTSGDLHMGHWFAWTGPDVFARFKRMEGENVLFPVGGFDAFGLPAENAAIKHGIHPREWTYKNIETMRTQFETMGPSFDWDKEVITCDPDYYKWTQFLFLKMYEKGLAYRDKVWSNWCPECKTVVANEHVQNGCCWRHTSTPVEQKKVEQWLVRITDYADKLIWSKDRKVDWPQEAIEGQNNWIGRSEGMRVKWEVVGKKEEIETFTTRPDTIMGATFLVLSPEHEMVHALISNSGTSVLASSTSRSTPLLRAGVPPSELSCIREYVEKAKKKIERERLSQAKEKSGVFSGLYAINPASGKEIPVWIADFVLSSYGTGAIMGVPAHDERDMEFAKKYHLDIVKIKPDKFLWEKIAENGWGKREVNYHLRDWSVSRQRYWGAPVPIIYCKKCGTVPVPEKDLPVKLPEKVDYTPTGKAPLATALGWVRTICPKCGGEARRDTETLDTYMDSSWYFFRYPNPKYKKGLFDKKLINEWMPIKIYFGGPEHILGHTLYARFVTKFLKDLGYIKFDEFVLKRRHHGVMLGPDGYRMSKSRGNVVNPDEQVKKFGADAVRVYICFLGPHEKGGTWKIEGIEGANRFLQRVWRLCVSNSTSKHQVTSPSGVAHGRRPVELHADVQNELRIKTNQTIKKVTEDIENLRFNTAVSALMEYTNFLQEKGASEENLEVLVKLLAPFAPHITEEIWQTKFAKDSIFRSIHREPWPRWDQNKIQEETVEVAVQVNGKLRAKLTVETQNSRIKDEVIARTKKEPNVTKYIQGKKIKKTIFVPGKIINFVV